MGLFAPVAAYLSARLGTRRAMTIGLALIGVFGVLRAVAPSAVARRAPDVARRHGHGPRQRARAARRARDGARPAGDGNGRLHDRHPDRLDRRRGDRGPARGPARRLARRADRAVGRRLRHRRRVGRARARRRGARAPPAGSSRGCRGGRARPGCWSRSSARWGRPTTGSTRGSPTRTASAAGATASAGLLLAAMNLTAIPCSFVIPWLSDRHGGRRPWLAGVSAVLRDRRHRARRLPRGGVPLGAARRDRAGRHVRARDDAPARLRVDARSASGALVGLMLGVGYSIAAISPFVLGAVRDVTGSFDAVLWVCAGFLVAARRARPPAAAPAPPSRSDGVGRQSDSRAPGGTSVSD